MLKIQNYCIYMKLKLKQAPGVLSEDNCLITFISDIHSFLSQCPLVVLAKWMAIRSNFVPWKFLELKLFQKNSTCRPKQEVFSSFEDRVSLIIPNSHQSVDTCVSHRFSQLLFLNLKVREYTYPSNICYCILGDSLLDSLKYLRK